MTDTTSGKGVERSVLRKGNLLILSLFMAFLGDCTLTGSLAKEGVLSLTEREGRERFTLTGELPAHFSIQATAYFSPDNPERCQVYSIGQGVEVTRELITQYTTTYHDRPTDIPRAGPAQSAVRGQACQCQCTFPAACTGSGDLPGTLCTG